METLLYNISQVLGISILHSLWQGLLIYAVIRLLLIGFPAISATKKYNLLYTGLMVMTVWFAYTFFMEAKMYNWTANQATHFSLPTDAPVYSNSEIKPTTQPDQPFYYNYKQVIKNYLPYISVLYLLSVVINLVRLAAGWQKMRSIKKQVLAAATWQPLTDKLAERAGILKYVQISFSNLIDVPCAFGHLKPILLLPVSISTQLSAEEIEVIILHELAHIKNNDYILNLIQQIVALLLFLNPFAQLVSTMIDLERENRCDDTVLQIGDPLTYAGALVKLEKARQQNLQLAMAATGRKYHLFARIQRIMGGDKPAVNIKHLVFGMLIFIGGLGSIAWLNPEIKDGRLSSKNGEAVVQQLTKIVKEVLVPAKSEQMIPKKKPDDVAVVGVADSTATITVVDSAVVKKTARQALLAELSRLWRELGDDNEQLLKLPAYQELAAVSKAMSSLKINDDELPPELLQERIEHKRITDEYDKSAVYIERKATYKKFVAAFKQAMQQHPEMVAFEELYNRQRDSVRNRIMRINRLTTEQTENYPDWKKWLREASGRRSAVELKLFEVPEIKALKDSTDNATHMLYGSPEFKEYNEKTKASPAYKAFMDTVLEQYRVRNRKALAELQGTPEWQKQEKDSKRYNELVRKLSN